MKPALFIIDFDLTITQEHIHNMLNRAIYHGFIHKDDVAAQWDLVKEVLPTGSTEKWKFFLEKLIQDGHLVAVASFSEFKPIIERYLKDKIGVEEHTLKKIYIESWLPENPQHANKNQHIQNVINHFHYQGDPHRVILTDDSAPNCSAARINHYVALEAIPGDPSAKHLEILTALSTELAKE